VTFRLLLPSTRSFCDQLETCQFSASHISFSTTTGQSLQIGTQWCATICSAQCTPSPCPGIPCAIGGGVAVTTVEQTWDGSYYESSTCGQGMACVIPRHVPPGHYVARVCATPGTLAESDGGPPSCMATGPQECVDVPFDLPGPSPIEVSLPDVAP
jgi:hypothetical protein